MRRPQNSLKHPCTAAANVLFAPERARARGTIRRCVAPALVGAVLALLDTAAARAAEPEDIRGPDVTIIDEEERTVFEYRQGGVLRMVRVVPEWGKPYYLVPRDQTTGYEDLERSETLLPTWVIVEF